MPCRLAWYIAASAAHTAVQRHILIGQLGQPLAHRHPVRLLAMAEAQVLNLPLQALGNLLRDLGVAARKHRRKFFAANASEQVAPA